MGLCCDFSKITAKNEKQTEEVKLSLFEDYLIVYFLWMKSTEKLLDLISKKLKALTLGGKKVKLCLFTGNIPIHMENLMLPTKK